MMEKSMDQNHIVEKRVPGWPIVIGALVLMLPVVAVCGVASWVRERFADR
jgi:hypothetical protein